MSGKQTMNWNGDADAKLLLAILKVTDVKPDFEAVAKQLTTDTTTCTPRAVQEHLKKLRKIAQAGSTAPSNNEKPTKAAASRKGAGTGAGVKKSRKPAAGGRGRKKGKSAPVDDDAEDDETFKEEDGHDDREESAGMEDEMSV